MKEIPKNKFYKEAFNNLISCYLIIDNNKLTRKQKIKEINKIRDKHISYVHLYIKIFYPLRQIIEFLQLFNKKI